MPLSKNAAFLVPPWIFGILRKVILGGVQKNI